MEPIADRGRRVAIEELNTTRLLAHARKQARQRNLDDVLSRIEQMAQGAPDAFAYMSKLLAGHRGG